MAPTWRKPGFRPPPLLDSFPIASQKPRMREDGSLSATRLTTARWGKNLVCRLDVAFVCLSNDNCLVFLAVNALFLFVYLVLKRFFPLSSCLSSYLFVFFPLCLLSSLSSFLSVFFPLCLPSYLPSFLFAFLPLLHMSFTLILYLALIALSFSR